MNIVVCVKQVPDTNLPLHLNSDGKNVDPSKLSYVINPYDEYALEEALQIKEQIPSTIITAITLGSEDSEQVLRHALALGVDDAIHVLKQADQHLCALDVSKILSEVIKSKKADIVLCGRQAVDDDAFQVGSGVGVILNYPIVAFVSRVEVDNNEIKVERVLNRGGTQIFKLDFPCVLTCQKGLNDPRYPSLPGVMKAKKKEIKKVLVSEFNLDLKKAAVLKSVKFPEMTRKQIILDDLDQGQNVFELIKLLKSDSGVIS